MWQRQILVCIARNDPEIVIRPATKKNQSNVTLEPFERKRSEVDRKKQM